MLNIKNLWTRVFFRRLLLFLLDSFLGILSLYLAFVLRFDWQIPPPMQGLFPHLIPIVLAWRSLSYVYCRFYTRFWEYSSLGDLLLIIRAVFFGSALILFSSYLFGLSHDLPRSIIVIDFVLLICFLGGTRLGWRLWRERLQRKDNQRVHANRSINTLIFGAGDKGAAFLRSVSRQYPQFNVCGLIDDNPGKKNQMLMGMKVLGDRHDLPDIVLKLGVKELFIAADNVRGKNLQELIEICNRSQIRYKMVAATVDMSTQEFHISKIRNLEIVDLLGRDPVSLDFASIETLIKGKRILVTGAGGSIGSELCRQILEFKPAVLLMADKGENYLHELRMRIETRLPPGTETRYLFCSVTHKEKMAKLFSVHRPQVVFHAAAHKHVPLMEDNADEAVINNMLGTKVVAELSDRTGVEKFVLISTDKVVRPANVMGMTKKGAELYIQHIGQKSKTGFITVRFGNVLGSNSSVVPLFQKQIEEGGPVTVTHPDMQRFFMLIPEAAQLVLQAGAMGKGREIFMLEMGEQVKIVDLAEKMIRMAGFDPEKDIEIKFTGIREGEKLFEELIAEDEKPVPTFHEKIKILRSGYQMDSKLFERDYETLLKTASESDGQKVKSDLKQFIEKHNAPQSPGETGTNSDLAHPLSRFS